MKKLLRCHADFILPDDFEGSVAEALRMFANYLEATPAAFEPKVEVDVHPLPRTDLLRYLTRMHELVSGAEARGLKLGISELCVQRFDEDTSKWVRTADEMNPCDAGHDPHLSSSCASHLRVKGSK